MASRLAQEVARGNDLAISKSQRRHKRGVARVITAFDVEIVDRIAREHPDLSPEDDDAEPSDSEDWPPRSSRN